MPDNLKKKIPQDASRISLSQSHEVKYWCERLGCTEDELEEAVKNVGDSADDVEKYLAKKRRREANRSSGWSR